jgi:hypothetical protein
VTKINSGALPAVQWRSRPGAFSPRSGFLGTGVPGIGIGTGPCATVVRQVPRVRNEAALTVPATKQLEQTDNYNHMTSVVAFGEGASGPPPYREPA